MDGRSEAQTDAQTVETRCRADPTSSGSAKKYASELWMCPNSCNRIESFSHIAYMCPKYDSLKKNRDIINSDRDLADFFRNIVKMRDETWGGWFLDPDFWSTCPRLKCRKSCRSSHRWRDSGVWGTLSQLISMIIHHIFKSIHECLRIQLMSTLTINNKPSKSILWSPF